MDTIIKDLDKNNMKKQLKHIESFIRWSGDYRDMNENLVIAVINHFGADIFLSDAVDIAKNGITDYKYNGFADYPETDAFYKKNKALINGWAKDYYGACGPLGSYIIELASRESMRKKRFGVDEIAEFIYSNNDDLEDYSAFSKLMVLFVGDVICTYYSEYLDDEEEDLLLSQVKAKSTAAQ